MKKQAFLKLMSSFYILLISAFLVVMSAFAWFTMSRAPEAGVSTGIKADLNILPAQTTSTLNKEAEPGETILAWFKIPAQCKTTGRIYVTSNVLTDIEIEYPEDVDDVDDLPDTVTLEENECLITVRATVKTTAYGGDTGAIYYVYEMSGTNAETGLQETQSYKAEATISIAGEASPVNMGIEVGTPGETINFAFPLTLSAGQSYTLSIGNKTALSSISISGSDIAVERSGNDYTITYSENAGSVTKTDQYVNGAWEFEEIASDGDNSTVEAEASSTSATTAAETSSTSATTAAETSSTSATTAAETSSTSATTAAETSSTSATTAAETSSTSATTAAETSSTGTTAAAETGSTGTTAETVSPSVAVSIQIAPNAAEGVTTISLKAPADSNGVIQVQQVTLAIIAPSTEETSTTTQTTQTTQTTEESGTTPEEPTPTVDTQDPDLVATCGVGQSVTLLFSMTLSADSFAYRLNLSPKASISSVVLSAANMAVTKNGDGYIVSYSENTGNVTATDSYSVENDAGTWTFSSAAAQENVVESGKLKVVLTVRTGIEVGSKISVSLTATDLTVTTAEITVQAANTSEETTQPYIVQAVPNLWDQLAETTASKAATTETTASETTSSETTSETTASETTSSETTSETTASETTKAETTSSETTAETTASETTKAETTSSETTAETTASETTKTETTSSETTAETTASETTKAETTSSETTAETTASETTKTETTSSETTTAETTSETTTKGESQEP